MAVVYRCVGFLTVDVVVFFRSPGVFHSQESFPSTFRPRLWETSSGVVAVGVFAAEARRGHQLSVFQYTYRPQPSNPELFNKNHNAGRKSLEAGSHLCGASRCVHIGNSSGHAARRFAAKVSCFKMDRVVSLALLCEEAGNEEYEVRNKRKRFIIT